MSVTLRVIVPQKIESPWLSLCTLSRADFFPPKRCRSWLRVTRPAFLLFNMQVAPKHVLDLVTRSCVGRVTWFLKTDMLGHVIKGMRCSGITPT